ncbi:lipoyl protein ligase domain-containing protein [Sporomusa acidovorans]|uniref:Octanoyltransferase LipM n=1 Tax=Sporomusa acidovorans (strain ATCC 49682 / DSM 3132 / Mol) TaxID=1123286 RepID=A0ABZ3J514_SPOA4|nr:DUF116 domain-containing protein [Sporomusa acidovorans]OZC15637.1 octanoyltransferase LipM [Sporomusa acidovorans DSM 3132]SDE87950.1 lipoate-protein ligase A [Sporomusa acidovorans]
MKQVWQVIDSGYETCFQGIATDKTLLAACSRQVVADTIRFFQYDADCIILGYYQKAEQEVRLSFCKDNGITVSRRLTGGKTIYWDREATLGWEVVLYQQDVVTPRQIEALQRKIGAALVSGLKMLGLNVRYQYPSTIELAGCEIGWFCGTRTGQAFLYQGYIYSKDIDVSTLLRALRIPREKLQNKDINKYRKKFTSLADALGEVPSLNTVKSAMILGFCQVFDISTVSNHLPISKDYLDTACQEVAAPQWVFNRATALPSNSYQLRNTYTKRTFITVSVFLDRKQRCITGVSITGDFAAYPANIIEKIEAGLIGLPPDVACISQTISTCFTNQQAHVLLVSPEIFTRTIGKAVDKLAFLQWGAKPEDILDLTMVGNVFNHISGGKHKPLLIPYCAKAVDCPYRYTEGCGRCGRCDVSEAYSLADQYGLEPITIQNYEMLEETLKNLKKRGCKLFIGTCCESFWNKHARDFEQIGLPGILVNVDDSTCYELGQEQEAYQGHFANQTKLKKQLLCRLLEGIS